MHYNTIVSPTLKHLFKGNDVTIFAYGVTGSGKTHTMKGNRAAAERGIIPRLLTAIYRRGKDMEKKTNGETSMTAIMSYYEIYNDRVFDLFEAPEKRTLAGLPLREQNGKTHVVGLTEKEISTLKEFETLYDMANNHRSTSATKLNNQSSRSHAIICVRVEIRNNGTGETKIGTVSCIDLAGSEDNRRTANDKDRMVGMCIDLELCGWFGFVLFILTRKKKTRIGKYQQVTFCTVSVRRGDVEEAESDPISRVQDDPHLESRSKQWHDGDDSQPCPY